MYDHNDLVITYHSDRSQYIQQRLCLIIHMLHITCVVLIYSLCEITEVDWSDEMNASFFRPIRITMEYIQTNVYLLAHYIVSTTQHTITTYELELTTCDFAITRERHFQVFPKATRVVIDHSFCISKGLH